MTLTQIVSALVRIVGLVYLQERFLKVTTLGKSAICKERTHAKSNDCD